MRKIIIIFVNLLFILYLSGCVKRSYGYTFHYSVSEGKGELLVTNNKGQEENNVILCSDLKSFCDLTCPENSFFIRKRGGKKGTHELIFIAKPDEGYQVIEWMFNGEIVLGNTSNTFTASVSRKCDYTGVISVKFGKIKNKNNNISFENSNYSGYGCNNGNDLKENINNIEKNAALENEVGLGCGSNCGSSREDGYSSTYKYGCRNWQVMPIISPHYSYWIDETSLSSLTDLQKEEFIYTVEKAAEVWNSVRIADYLGPIVNLERKYSNDSGVVPIRFNPSLEDGTLGQFNPNPLSHEIEIKIYNDYDTILHEFGHMLGLQDLDMNNDPATHISLMGYAGKDELLYQDIQGLSVANSKHQNHDFRKYWIEGDKYNYVCFYCDITDSVKKEKYGGSVLEYSSSCKHEYEMLASAGERYWQKCPKCYKVIECEFTVNVIGDNSLEITGILDNRTEILVPSQIGGQNVVGIADNAFKNQNIIKNIFFEKNSKITYIGNLAFKDCISLISIIIPNTVTNIYSSAFEGCTSLKLISLSSNLTSIGDSAFKGCSSLECITIPNTIKNIESNTFENCTSLKTIDLPDFLESIGNLAFKDCIKLENLTTPNTLNSIGTSAFYRCTSLQSVTLSTNLESINDFTFNGCTSLISITIPTSVIRVGSFSFQNCTSLQSVTFSNKLISIESRAFNGCTSLESLILPDSVKNIESNAFESCTGLLSVVLSNNLESIGSSSFEGCSNLTNIVIPSSVENICIYAFKNCISLQNVNILRNSTEITNLESLVFLGCSNNLEITVPRSVFYIYCKANNWNQYALQIVPDIPFEEISLDCITKDKNLINNEYDELYKLNVYCTKTYKFTSTDNVSMIIYDVSMNEKVSGIDYLECYMSKGTYYLDINSDVDTFSINYGYLYSSTGTQIDICETNSITSLLHESSGNKKHGVFNFYNNDSSGFYKISLKSGSNTLFPKESIKIYTDSAKDEILDRYYDKNIDSITYLNENELYVYLSKYHYYYLDILIYNYSNVTLTIERVETNDIDYLDGLNYTHFDVIFEYKNSISYFEEVNISQRSKIELDIVSSGSINESIPIYVLEKKYDASNSSYYLYTKLFVQITSINREPIFTLIMDPGTYYFGFHNNTDNVNINFALRRIVDYETNMTGTLVADPAKDQGYALGSEVLFNNGLCDNYTITEGFTRSIYLMVEDRVFDPMSRLEYDWYSNNDNIAKVTEFGTVLAMPVDEDTEVTIFAILKVDPSIVYYKTFTILNDLNEELIEIENEMDYSFSRQNGTYQLELDSNNSPFPMIQYYTWEIINNNDEIVTMDYWGNITSTGETVVEIIGTYNLNPRVKIYITLTILE